MVKRDNGRAVKVIGVTIIILIAALGQLAKANEPVTQGEPRLLVVPLMVLIGMLGPLYALVAGLYVLLFKHSTNDDRHFNPDACNDAKEQIRAYVGSVDTRAGKAVDDLKEDMNRQFDIILNEVRKSP